MMKKSLVFVAAILLAMGLFAQNGYKVGDTASDFNLLNANPLTNMDMVSMENFDEALGFIVVFTCNTCPVSKAYEDRIVELDKKYAPKGYPVIAVNSNDPERMPDDSFEAMQQRVEDKGFTFPYLVDTENKYADIYGATKTPHTYLLQRVEDVLKVAYIGAIDDSRRSSSVEETFLSNAVDNLLAGKKVEKPYTVAVGCTIKRALP